MNEEKEKRISIREWAEDDRPREKMLLKGTSALSDAELLAILIGSGTVEESAVEVSKRVLQLTGNNLTELGRLDLKLMQKVKGIGQAKAISIAAALELGRRRKLEEAKEEHAYIRSSNSAYQYFEPRMSDLPHEEFWVAYLGRNQRVLDVKRVSEGGVGATVADPKIIFKHAVELLASAVVLSHNHPSGSLKPSKGDFRLTQKLVQAGKLLDVAVADHIIIGERGYYSFADSGTLL